MVDIQFDVAEGGGEGGGGGRREVVAARGWGYRSVMLCLFGFLMYFKPAQPFLVDYLMTDKGFTSEEVSFSFFFPFFFLIFFDFLTSCPTFISLPFFFLIPLLLTPLPFSQVFKEIFPIWTYAQLAFMIIFGILAEFSRIGYYPIIVFGALCFLTEPAFMLWGGSVSVMQVGKRKGERGKGREEGEEDRKGGGRGSFLIIFFS